MASLHSVFYDKLPHLFMEFDIYDKQEKVFLDTKTRHEMLSKSVVPISSVKVLDSKIFESLEEIKSYVSISYFISENALNTLREEMISKRYPQGEQDLLLLLNKERLMEGLYLKWEEDGIVKGRYKYVRPQFVQIILDGETHWKERPTIYNRLIEGADMYAIGETHWKERPTIYNRLIEGADMYAIRTIKN